MLSFKNTFRLARERSKKVKFSASLKGYSTHKYRTNLRTNKMTFNDVFMIVLFVGFIAFYVWERSIS